jgi:hypothetical protein
MSLGPAASRDLLESLVPLLVKDGFAAHVQRDLGETPFGRYDILFAELETYGAGERQFLLQVSVLPGLEQQLTENSILQCFVPFRQGPVEPAARAQLDWLLVRLNSKLPLIGFGFLEEDSTLFFKHNAVLPDAPSPSRYPQVRDAVVMIRYLLDTFYATIMDVAEGRKTGLEALRASPFARVYIPD